MVGSFNNRYVNVAEQSSDLKPTALGQKSLSDKAGICSIIESYKNHPSIKQVRNNLKLLENEEKLCFKMVTTKYIKILLQKVNTKKSVGIDSIPSKLVKLAAEPLSQVVTEAISLCIKQNNLPNNAKVASVVLLDKGKSNKMSNFRPVSVFNTFSKIYEQGIKEQNVLGTEKSLSPEISAYRKLYSNQYVITSLIENWRGKVDKHFLVGAVLTYLLRAFD